MRTLSICIPLALALAGCTSTSYVGAPTESVAPVADILLTTDDLDELRPSIWTEAEVPSEVEGIAGGICGVECALRVWTAPGATLTITLNRHETAEQAADALAQAAEIATDRGYEEVEPPDYSGLPDNLWLGIADADGLPRVFLYTQHGPLVVVTWLVSKHALPEDDQRLGLVLITFDVTTAQWEKVMLGEFVLI